MNNGRKFSITQQLEEAMKMGMTADKSRRANKVTKVDSAVKNPDANYSMAVNAVSAGKIENALPLFRRAIAGNPREKKFWLSYIDALITSGRPDDARAVLDQAKEIGLASEAFDRLDILLLAMKGQKQSETGVSVHTHGSTDHYRPSILDTIDLRAALKLAKKTSKAGEVNEAKRIYEDILKIYPQNKMALNGHK